MWQEHTSPQEVHHEFHQARGRLWVKSPPQTNWCQGSGRKFAFVIVVCFAGITHPSAPSAPRVISISWSSCNQGLSEAVCFRNLGPLVFSVLPFVLGFFFCFLVVGGSCFWTTVIMHTQSLATSKWKNDPSDVEFEAWWQVCCTHFSYHFFCLFFFCASRTDWMSFWIECGWNQNVGFFNSEPYARSFLHLLCPSSYDQ